MKLFIDNLFWIILGGIVTLPLAILSNIWSEPVKTWLAKRSKASASERIIELEEHLDFLTELNRSSVKLMKYFFRRFSIIAVNMLCCLSMLSSALVINSLISDNSPAAKLARLFDTFDLTKIGLPQDTILQIEKYFGSPTTQASEMELLFLTTCLTILFPCIAYFFSIRAVYYCARLSTNLVRLNEFQKEKKEVESEIQKLREIVEK